MSKIYFFQPDKNHWDLESIEAGYKAKLHLHNSLVWQFGDLAEAQVLEANKENKVVTVRVLKSKEFSWETVPVGNISFEKHPLSIYTLPFTYLLSVAKNDDTLIEQKAKSSIFDSIKSKIIEEQRATRPKNKLISDIVEGKIKLLTEEDITHRLNISQKEFISWVRRSDPTYKSDLRSRENKDMLSVIEKLNLSLDNTKFPSPDIYIAGSARWSADTLESWLKDSIKKGGNNSHP